VEITPINTGLVAFLMRKSILRAEKEISGMFTR
jgi:hypothetical protein